MSRTRLPAALRREVIQRAAGCCEFCLLPQTFSFAVHQIDHIIAEKHGGPTEASNLCLCCIACNQFKGTDLSSIDPETRQPVMLFNPRQDKWTRHFRLEGARIFSLTPIGRVTVRLLHFNDPERLIERELVLRSGRLRVPAS